VRTGAWTVTRTVDELQGRASRHRARPRAFGPGDSDPWPGSATPLSWVMALLASGAAAGALIGALLGLLSPQNTTVSAVVEIRPESAILGDTLNPPLSIEQTNSLVTTEVARLTTLAEDLSDSPDTIDVTQVGTSALVRISATTPDAQVATDLVSDLVDTYVTNRRAVVEESLLSQQDAVAGRLQEIAAAGGGASGSPEQETQRLLSRQSELAEAVSRLDRLVAVVRPPAEDATSTAPKVVLYGMGGAALGGALVLGLGALWRARSSRLFDARQLAAAGIPLLHPRIPAGSLRARRGSMDLTQPAGDAVASARLLARQVFGAADGPQVVLLTGVCDRAGTEQVAWSLAWAVSSDRPVTVVAALPDLDEVPAEGRVTQVTPGITVVELPVGADDAPLVAAAGAHTARGSHLLVCVPPLTGALTDRGLAGGVDSALLVVGEHACTVEHALAAAQGFEADEVAAAWGVVVTTPRRWKRRGRVGRADTAASRRDPSPPTTRRAADEVTARSG
jgi:hypothetical protein